MAIKYDALLGTIRQADTNTDTKDIEYQNTKIYNANEGLKHFKPELEIVRNGLLTSPLYINCYGDSITEGGVSTNLNKTWVDRLRRLISECQGKNTGTGFIHPLYPIAQSGTNPFWTFNGSDWVENYGYGVHSSCKRTTVNGATATLNFYGTGIDIYALTGNFSGNNYNQRAMKLYIKKASEPDSAYTLNKTFDTYSNEYPDFFDNATQYSNGIIRNLPLDSYTLKIEAVIANSQTLYLLGAIPFIENGIVVNNMGYWGRTAKQFYNQELEGGNSTLARFDAHITNWIPKLSFVAFGANDLVSQVSTATYSTYVQDIINSIRLNNAKADIVLLSLGDYDDSALTIKQSEYENALLTLAKTNNCCFINVTGMTDYTDIKAVTSGGNELTALNYDSVHPNDAGHEWIFSKIVQALNLNLKRFGWNETAGQLTPGVGGQLPATVAILASEVSSYGFSGASGIDAVQCKINTPHNIVSNSTSQLHIHFLATGSNEGYVKIKLALIIYSMDGTLRYNNTLSLVKYRSATTNAMTFDFTIPISLNKDDQLLYKWLRDADDAEDTYADSVILMTEGLHYLSDNVGSVTIIEK
jgi:lysophospholipase L1-like esterase